MKQPFEEDLAIFLTSFFFSFYLYMHISKITQMFKNFCLAKQVSWYTLGQPWFS